MVLLQNIQRLFISFLQIIEKGHRVYHCIMNIMLNSPALILYTFPASGHTALGKL